MLSCFVYCYMYVSVRVILGSHSRVDSSGWPACEKCGQRLNRVKHHRAHGNGRACTPRCKTLTNGIDDADNKISPASSSSSSSSLIKVKPIKRKRSELDLGKQENIITTQQPMSLRVRPPKPMMTDKKQQKTIS